MSKFSLLRAVSIWAVTISAIGCVATKPLVSQQNVKDVPDNALYPASTEPGCMSMMHSYCHLLYSPSVSGNMKIESRQNPLFVLLGKTRNNFSAAYFAYAQATLRARPYLPADFRRNLDKQNYFDLLYRSMNRKPRSQMTLSERIQAQLLQDRLDRIWNGAVFETVMSRMDARFPGFHKLRDASIPIELQVARSRIRRSLLANISKQIWERHPNWLRVQRDFQELKKHFLSVIARLDIPSDVAQDWEKRIKSVKLVLPGSLPELTDTGCSQTTSNAYYYTDLNIITVCAGDFNSENILETLSHELAHSLDLSRSRYIFDMKSQVGKNIKILRAQLCSPTRKTKFTCSEWKKFKQDFPDEVSALYSYKPQLVKFNECLKVRPTYNTITDKDIARWASSIESDKLADIADMDFFLRIIKKKVILPDGTIRRNPNYMDPCSYYLYTQNEESLDDEINILAFFTAEYRCESGPSAQKFKNSIKVASNMSESLVRAMIKDEGEFSGREAPDSEGYAAPPNERFADVIGSYALADMLHDIPSVLDRRSTFLASSSWQCQRPSLDSEYPVESAIEDSYTGDDHSEGARREMEFFSAPIRQAIECRADFSFPACSLKFKSQKPPVQTQIIQRLSEYSVPAQKSYSATAPHALSRSSLVNSN